MKRGQLIILWIGGILSAALLILSQAPDPVEQKISLTLGAYVINVLTKLAVIWIVCGLVWVTMYKRSRTNEKNVAAKPIEVTKNSQNERIVPTPIKHLRTFVAATVRDWIGRMSGGGGLALTIFGFFSPPILQPRAFLGLGVLCLFYACYRAWLSEHKRAEELLQNFIPRLEFVRVNNVKPFYEQFDKESGTTLRYMRVGVHNSGAVEIPQVRLVLEGCEPGDSAAVHPEHELQPMGKPEGTMAVTIPPHGTVIFDVAQEVVVPPEHYGSLLLCYAQNVQNELPRRDTDSYKIILRAEGAGPAKRCSLELGGRVAWRLDGLTVLPST